MDKKNNQVLLRIVIAFVVWCLAYWGITLLCDKVLFIVSEGISYIVNVIVKCIIPLVLVYPVLRGLTTSQSGTPVIKPTVLYITKMFLIQSGFSVMVLTVVTIIIRVLNINTEQSRDDTAEMIKQYPLVMMVVLLIFTPIVNEILFRMMFFDRLVVLGTKKAVVISALFYSFPFLLFKGPTLFVYSFVIGLSIGYVRARTKRLLPCIILNALDNLYYRVLLAFLYPLDKPISMMIFVFVYILAIPIIAIVLVVVNRRKFVISP